jgi:hypothetical protein
MKKLLLTAAAVLAAVNIYAQGIVNPNTFNHSFANNLVTGAGVSLADGIRYQVYWSAPGAGDFVAASPVLTIGTIAGYSIGQPNVTVGVAAGNMVDVQLRAWELAYGATHEAAAAAPQMGGRGAIIGESSVITVTAGGGLTTPPALVVGAWTVNAVPEPSVIALGLVGAGALLLLRRRK